MKFREIIVPAMYSTGAGDLQQSLCLQREGFTAGLETLILG